MATIYRDSETKYSATKLIFGNDVDPYCYHDFARTKKMTDDELRDAVLNGAMYIDVTANPDCSDNTPPNRFTDYSSILTLSSSRKSGVSYSHITIVGNPSNITRYSAEYTA